MSHIKNIEIKNFKSIRHAKLEDCRRVNVLIGYPNVGKSNILEAISIFQYVKSDRKTSLREFVRYEDAGEIFFEGNARNNAVVSYNNEKSIYVEYSDSNSVGVTPEEYDENREFIPFESKNIGIGTSSILDVYKYQFDLRMLSNDTAYKLKHLEAPYGQNLYLILREYEGLRKEFNELLSNYELRLLLDKTSNSLKLIKTIDKDSIFQIPFSLLADTLQRLMFYKTAIATNSDSVLLFEEPEAHMFPPYIANFTTDIIFDKNNNQYFIATHSPFVLNDFMEDMDKNDLSIYAVGLKNGETVIRRLTDEEIGEVNQYGIDLFFNLESYLKDGFFNNA